MLLNVLKRNSKKANSETHVCALIHPHVFVELPTVKSTMLSNKHTCVTHPSRQDHFYQINVVSSLAHQ